MLSRYENKGNVLIAGCDEAGRGCLAGPVYAAAVILDEDFHCPELNDSKKLNHNKRMALRTYIEANARAYAVAACDHIEIDKNNILKSSFIAMHKAIGKLKEEPGLLLIDGNRFLQFENIEHECIVKGDGKYESIAAASILAKTYRDEFMQRMHLKYPYYDWKQNKGYPTKKHRAAILKYGVSPIHRMSFKLIKDPQ